MFYISNSSIEEQTETPSLAGRGCLKWQAFTQRYAVSLRDTWDACDFAVLAWQHATGLNLPPRKGVARYRHIGSPPPPIGRRWGWQIRGKARSDSPSYVCAWRSLLCPAPFSSGWPRAMERGGAWCLWRSHDDVMFQTVGRTAACSGMDTQGDTLNFCWSRGGFWGHTDSCRTCFPIKTRVQGIGLNS